LKILSRLGLTVLQLLKAAWSLPQTISNAAKRRQQRSLLQQLEVERLDRIRNPSKYRGK